jgi:hypothetical protein
MRFFDVAKPFAGVGLSGLDADGTGGCDAAAARSKSERKKTLKLIRVSCSTFF